MRAPDFWWRKGRSFIVWLLMPFAWLYGFLAARRLAVKGKSADVPVLCIGNFTVGGAGKTPIAIRLCRILEEMGETPYFLSRGYGGSEKGPLAVEPEHHDATQIGDEPLLLARHAPTVVARDRIAGARLCAQLGASVIIMDDGMQNPYLAKDLTIAVVDGQTGTGNSLPFPAGPLRLSMERQWPLVDAVVIVGAGDAGMQIAELARSLSKLVLHTSLVPDERAAGRLEGQRVLAFAGIGRPEKFFTSLRECGALVIRQRKFPDHHRFSDAELNELAEEARENDLLLVTTEKDLARIPEGTGLSRQSLEILPVEMAFSLPEQEAITGLIQRHLVEARRKRETPVFSAG